MNDDVMMTAANQNFAIQRIAATEDPSSALVVFTTIAWSPIAVVFVKHASSILERSVLNLPVDWHNFGPGISDGPGH